MIDSDMNLYLIIMTKWLVEKFWEWEWIGGAQAGLQYSKSDIELGWKKHLSTLPYLFRFVLLQIPPFLQHPS